LKNIFQNVNLYLKNIKYFLEIKDEDIVIDCRQI